MGYATHYLFLLNSVVDNEEEDLYLNNEIARSLFLCMIVDSGILGRSMKVLPITRTSNISH